MPMYGRACSLYPRTIEMIDQLDLSDELNQVGIIGRGSVTFTGEGERVTARSINAIFSQMGRTFLDYVLNIRLKYSEDLIRKAYLRVGDKVKVKWEIRDIEQDVGNSDGYKVLSKIGAADTDETQYIRRQVLSLL